MGRWGDLDRAALPVTVSPSPYLPISPLLLEPLENDRDTLAAADAGGADAEPLVLPAKRVREVGGDPRPGRAERMAERDRAAVRVHLLVRELELLLDGEELRRERLVDV